MKKILLILAIGLIGCSHPSDSPVPLTAKGGTTSSTSYTFTGNWNCEHWVVDDITGATHRREMIFSGETSSTVDMSLNDYYGVGLFNQLLTLSHCDIDSNYFDNATNPLGTKYKGVMTTDSTLMVHQYEVGPMGIVDTVQSKEFLKQ
jgi:hypothetical protein